MLLNTVKESMRGPVKIFFGQSKIYVRLYKLKSRGFRASNLSTYEFSTLYTTLHNHCIKNKLVDLIDNIFQKEIS